MEYFVCALTKYAGACTAVLGGLGAFVFTAGDGEPSAMVRAALCKKLAGLGEKIDDEADAAEKQRISAPGSVVSLWVASLVEASRRIFSNARQGIGEKSLWRWKLALGVLKLA